MTNINGVTYYPKAAKENGQFYPVVFFTGSKIGSQTFYLNDPKPTRSQALTVSKIYIKNLKP